MAHSGEVLTNDQIATPLGWHDSQGPCLPGAEYLASTCHEARNWPRCRNALHLSMRALHTQNTGQYAPKKA